MTRLFVGSVLCGAVVAGASAGFLFAAIPLTSDPPSLLRAPSSSLEAEAGAALPVDLGPEDRAYRELFTPSSSPSSTFAVYRSAEELTSLAARLRALDTHPAAGAWDVEKTGVFDAFGAEGPYDKGRLARLFGGSSPRAARGSLVMPPGRVAVALISPYPDLAITSLQQGTLVIVTRLPSHQSPSHQSSVLRCQLAVISFAAEVSDSRVHSVGGNQKLRLDTHTIFIRPAKPSSYP